MEKAKVFDQHAENTEFSAKLDFYKDEIKIFKNRLEEIVSKNNQTECLSELEKFQNQLIIQRNIIDELKHKVNVDEDRLLDEIKKNEVAIDHRSIENHSIESEEMLSFEKNFHELRHDINLFFTKWM